MKKISILLFLLLLTGCSVKYNMEFKDNTIYENFTVGVNNKEEADSVKYLTDNDFYAYITPKMIKYNKTISKSKNITKFNYAYEYNVDNYKDSMALSSCFRGYNMIKEKNYYLLSTTKGLKCMTSDYSTIIDDIDIIISSNHKLIETNADEISGYKYIWHINKDNYLEKYIMLKVYQDKYILNYKSNFTKKILIIVLSVGVIIAAVMTFIIKRKKANKI